MCSGARGYAARGILAGSGYFLNWLSMSWMEEEKPLQEFAVPM